MRMSQEGEVEGMSSRVLAISCSNVKCAFIQSTRLHDFDMEPRWIDLDFAHLRVHDLVRKF